ncbi:hypothetical protein DSCA_58760 [Desulfosarcina alkanivorans]|uniref:EF-hand domain-containing protein n=1 Tax=Desulfosarcina alkanivorans TaxID=571177 RepID=A0A5K7YRQ1_9BACT|nr:hypothetical protein [Desulfosarcina alkanivorans]BBO71946.1 hypothetical protein DSCA_58760 [Desulfosarcina alkanivorans]
MHLKTLASTLAILALTLPPLALAGHHYGGHGNMDMVWDMAALDTDGNGRLTFAEFIAPNMEKWRSGFDMIDTNGDGDLGVDEWNAFLEVHSMKSGQ